MPRSESPSVIAVEGATVIGPSPTSDARVVVRGDRIAAVGILRDVPLPEDATVVHADGQYLIPGLLDVHAHVQEDQDLRKLLACGVTTVRNPARQGSHAPSSQVHVPRVLTAGPPIDRAPSAVPWAACVDSEGEMRDAVSRQAASGVDFIKLYMGLPPALVRAGVEQAHECGLRAIGDLVETSWTDAAAAGIDFLCHAVPRHPSLLPPAARAGYRRDVASQGVNPLARWLDLVELDGPEIKEMTNALASAEVVVDPTLVALEAMLFCGLPAYHQQVDADRAMLPPPLILQPRAVPELSGEQQRALHARAERAWCKALGLVQRLKDGGVRILAGTDAPRPWVTAGPSLHRELALLVDAGLSPAEALAAATVDAAAALGLATEVGRIQPGACADLVLLANDPLASITHTRSIVWVMKAGDFVR